MPVDYDAPLSITLEHGQKRVKRGLLSAICSGKTWGRSFYSDTWVDPELKAGMLRPYQIAPEYSTTGTGNYVRLAKANYSLTSPTKWVDHDRGRCTGDVYLHALDVNETVITSSTYEANRGFLISYYAYNVGNDDFLQLECGWGSSASHGKSAMSLKVYSNGRIECFRNGVYIGEATLKRRADDTDDATRLMWDKGGAQVAQETVDLLLLPMARRSLLVYCPTTQGSAVFTVEDIADDDTTTVLIPSGLKFWWYVPSGQATVQVSPCRFPASGYLTAQRTVFPLPVPADATFEFFTFVDPAYPGTDGASVAASMVEVNSPTTAFVPDGEKTECRTKIAFSSGIGTHTPFVYGAHGFVMPEIVETPGADLDLISYVLEASLSVPESHTDVAFSLKLKEPEAVEGLSGGEKLRRIQNRPIKISIDGIDLIDGRLNIRNWEEAVSDEARELDAEARDAWQTLERGLVPSDIPLDSLSLEEAWTYLLRFVGIDVESIEIDPVDFTLPTNGNTAEGDFAVMMKVGDTYGQWVSDLRDTYAGTWALGFVPTATSIKFRVVDPSQGPDDADVVLYSRIEDAHEFWVAEGESEAEANRLAPYRVFRSYKEQPQFPEANEIRVTGYDWRLRKAIHVVKRDESALDPEAEIAERPDNWTGELLPYAWVDSRITSVAAAERCCELLYDRLTQKMPLAEFEAEFVRKPDASPLWKGDLVRLDGIGLFRVVALTANFEKEPTKTDNWRWRTTKYVVEMKEREEASE